MTDYIYSREYLDTVLEKAKRHLPRKLFQQIHNAAYPSAGGKARWREGQREGDPHSHEYVQAILDKTKAILIDNNYKWLWDEINAQAIPSAGGKARARSIREQKAQEKAKQEKEQLQKVALVEMTPSNLAKLPDDEIRLSWLRLNQWYGTAKANGNAIEPFVNAAIFVMREFDKRHFAYNRSSPLVREAQALMTKKQKDVITPSKDETVKSEKEGQDDELEKVDAKTPDFFGGISLPNDVVVVTDFINVVGSTVTGKRPNDLDVLFRAEHDKSGKYYLIQADNIAIQVRKLVDPNKNLDVRYTDSPQGPHADYVPLYDLVLRKKGKFERHIVKEWEEIDESDDETIQKESVSPGSHFSPEKPSMASVTEFFNTKELWDQWAKDKLAKGAKLTGEIKYDGFRCILSKNGQGVSLWFEDAQQNRSSGVPMLVEAVKKAPFDSFVLDGEMLGKYKGNLIPRVQQMDLLTGKPIDFDPFFYCFDCLYFNGQDLSKQPLSDRMPYAKKVVSRLDSQYFTLSVAKPITDEASLQSVGMWAASQKGSEGVVVKDMTQPYHFGATDDWSKCKTVFEIKVLCTGVESTKLGYTYHCALLDGDLTDFTNVVDYHGKKVTDLGKTFVAKDKFAGEGDTLNVRIEELIILRNPADQTMRSLAWGKPTPVGPDKSRPAYSTLQAISLARRAHILKEEVQKMDVSAHTGSNPLVMFVGLSPGGIEAARGQPMTGSVGATFNDEYLTPMGLTKDETAITYIVPLHLTTDNDLFILHKDKNYTREPTDSEIKSWLYKSMSELEVIDAPITVALGQGVKRILPLADFVIPHPNVIQKYGNKGELSRKIPAIKQRIAEVRKLQEQETRAAIAEKFWRENWYKMVPPSGEGRFVLHEHWRGLSQDELKLSRDELIASNHSVHSDLRLESKDALHGWTIFLGKAADNKVNRFVDLPPNDSLQVEPKQPEPKEWLTFSGTSAPGEVGATTNSYARFDIIDKGTYHVGVWREHMMEYFINGSKVKGKVQTNFAPMGGRRVWLINRPESQIPYADENKIDAIVQELKSKGQQWLIWSDGVTKPELIDTSKFTPTVKEDGINSYHQHINNEDINLNLTVRILKADTEERTVLGIVYEPNTIDTQGHWAGPDAIRKAAENYLENYRLYNLRHGKLITDANPIQSYVAERDMIIEGQAVKKGTWLLKSHILSDVLWHDIQTKKLNAYSLEGSAKLVPRQPPAT